MKIAVLAWGSLLWEPSSLRIVTDWEAGGPSLPLEFSRVSSSRAGALTLVIDPQYGVATPTYFAVSDQQELEAAIENLRKREGTTQEHIGYIDFKSGRSQSSILSTAPETIGHWLEQHYLDAAIWTDLSSNFADESKAQFSDINDPTMPFTIKNAQHYLHRLKPAGAAKAREYLKNAPLNVQTALRARMQGDPWLKEEP
jgi:hypothetical protein